MLALALLFDAVLLTVGAYALICGDRPEKIGAIVNLLATLASSAVRLSGVTTWQAGGLTTWIDLTAVLAFFWLACRSTRFWPVWSFGFILAVLAIDIAEIALPHMPFVFATGQAIYVYLALGSLALGTFMLSRDADPDHGFRSPCPRPQQDET